jgi:hypothetical protein
MTAAARRARQCALLLVVLLFAAGPGVAEDYLDREQFLGLAFHDAQPVARTLWLTAELKQEAERTLGMAPRALRVRYWAAGERTAWILDEIGKEQPITIGVVVERHRIEQLRVMAFRESRGWEIRHSFFTGQYRGIGLAGDGTLSRAVDGITGATLSVRAVNRAARLALWLDTRAEPGLASR